jgi:hypothetical protein
MIKTQCFSGGAGEMNTRAFVPGEPVVYCKVKYSNCPGPRAHDIGPAPKGETYAYLVDKYWVVVRMVGDAQVLLRTRRGKEHMVEVACPSLRRATWWEKLFYRHRFPQLDGQSPSTELRAG